jgi:hypothetical protein
LPEKEISLNDHLIIARTVRRPVALLVDSVSGVIDVYPGGVVESSGILPHMDYVEGRKVLQSLQMGWFSSMTSTHSSPWKKTERLMRQCHKFSLPFYDTANNWHNLVSSVSNNKEG